MKLPARLRRDKNSSAPTALEPLRAVTEQEPETDGSVGMVVLNDRRNVNWGKGTSMPLPESYAPDSPDVLRTLFGIDPDGGDVLV